eukprot:GHVS01030686.1.p1 GENE.GHVS01030686.1~~GHVS01030686.1.p1  ORF type:complete len:378 (+),score=82.05 GHVS01030686.1:1964-3097(+)
MWKKNAAEDNGETENMPAYQSADTLKLMLSVFPPLETGQEQTTPEQLITSYSVAPLSYEAFMTALSVCQLADTLVYTASLRRGIPAPIYESFVSNYSMAFHELSLNSLSLYIVAATRVFSPNTYWSYVQLLLAYLNCTHCNLTDYALWWVNSKQKKKGEEEEQGHFPPLCDGMARVGGERVAVREVVGGEESGVVDMRLENVVNWMEEEMRLLANEIDKIEKQEATVLREVGADKTAEGKKKEQQNSVMQQMIDSSKYAPFSTTSSSSSSRASSPFSSVQDILGPGLRRPLPALPPNSPVFSSPPFNTHSRQAANYYLSLIANTQRGTGMLFADQLNNNSQIVKQRQHGGDAGWTVNERLADYVIAFDVFVVEETSN